MAPDDLGSLRLLQHLATHEDHMRPITEAEANAITQILAEFSVPEQLGCLASIMFGVIIAGCDNDLNRAEPIVHQMISSLPHHWNLVKGIYEFDQMQPTSRPN